MVPEVKIWGFEVKFLGSQGQNLRGSRGRNLVPGSKFEGQKFEVSGFWGSQGVKIYWGSGVLVVFGTFWAPCPESEKFGQAQGPLKKISYAGGFWSESGWRAFWGQKFDWGFILWVNFGHFGRFWGRSFWSILGSVGGPGGSGEMVEGPGKGQLRPGRVWGRGQGPRSGEGPGQILAILGPRGQNLRVKGRNFGVKFEGQRSILVPRVKIWGSRSNLGSEGQNLRDWVQGLAILGHFGTFWDPGPELERFGHFWVGRGSFKRRLMPGILRGQLDGLRVYFWGGQKFDWGFTAWGSKFWSDFGDFWMILVDFWSIQGPGGSGVDGDFGSTKDSLGLAESGEGQDRGRGPSGSILAILGPGVKNLRVKGSDFGPKGQIWRFEVDRGSQGQNGFQVKIEGLRSKFEVGGQILPLGHFVILGTLAQNPEIWMAQGPLKRWLSCQGDFGQNLNGRVIFGSKFDWGFNAWWSILAILGGILAIFGHFWSILAVGVRDGLRRWYRGLKGSSKAILDRVKIWGSRDRGREGQFGQGFLTILRSEVKRSGVKIFGSGVKNLRVQRSFWSFWVILGVLASDPTQIAQGSDRNFLKSLTMAEESDRSHEGLDGRWDQNWRNWSEFWHFDKILSNFEKIFTNFDNFWWFLKFWVWDLDRSWMTSGCLSSSISVFLDCVVRGSEDGNFGFWPFLTILTFGILKFLKFGWNFPS